jgi:hypothetical protein
MPGPWDANLVAFNSQTLTSSTNSSGFNVGEGAELRVQLDVAGTVSGTSPTLDVKLQDSADGSCRTRRMGRRGRTREWPSRR